MPFAIEFVFSLPELAAAEVMSQYSPVLFPVPVIVYLYIQPLSPFERLPVFNKSTWRHYKSTAEADDWSNPSGEPRDASKYKAKQDKMKANRTL